MNKSKISVIVPVYNAEKYIEKCIESVTSQTYQNFELVLVDDGSKDSSGDICKAYASKDERIKYIHQQNSGVSTARNTGLDNASGEFVMFLDSDDSLKPDAIKILLSEINESSVDMVVCGYEIIHADFVEKIQPKEKYCKTKKEIKELFSDCFLEAVASSVWGKIYRKSFINHCFDKNLTMGEDLLFNLGYVKQISSVKVISDTLYMYNVQNQESLVRKYKKEYYAQDKIVCLEWLNWFKETQSDSELINVYYHIYRSFFSYLKSVVKDETIQDKEQLLFDVADDLLIQSIELSQSRCNLLQKWILTSIVKKKFKKATKKVKVYLFIKRMFGRA